MGSFRSLSTQDVEQILAAFGRGGYHAHAPIAAGTINTNLKVITATEVLFLRVNEGKEEEDVRREAAIVGHVADRGVPTPMPLPARSGARYIAWGGSFVSLFPWVPGRTLARHELQARHAEEAARALARLHAEGATFGDHRPGRYEPEEISRRLGVIEAARDPELAGALTVLRPELADLSTARAASLPCGLIHGDLFVDNVLFGDDGRLSAMLDFEQASWGRLAYDVAVTLLAFGFGREGFREDLSRAFLNAYAQARPPEPEETAAFGAELRFACCRFAVTRITDVHLRRGQGSPGGKDYRRYLQRLDAVKALWKPEGSLLSLASP